MKLAAVFCVLLFSSLLCASEVPYCYVHISDLHPFCGGLGKASSLPPGVTGYTSADCSLSTTDYYYRECRKAAIAHKAGSRSNAAASALSKMSVPRAERSFVQGDWQLKDQKNCKGSIKSFFATLRVADFDDVLLTFQWRMLLWYGTVFDIAGPLIPYLHQVYTERRGKAGIFEAIACDRGIVWLGTQISAVALDDSLPFENRKLLSADCAEKHVEMFVAQESLSTDEHETLVRIVRMMLIPLASIPS